ncbi:MAG: pirin family protein, partial [Phycisphaerales bacterium]|nr:pirin family protein [Phycisphaerales bacterium]
RDMEIISYVLDGALEHRDSLGNGSILRAGDFQRMTAGTGVEHSEFSPSPTEPAHFYQIWIRPSENGLAPGYEERRQAEVANATGLRLVASPDGHDGSLTIHQDASIHLASVTAGETLLHAIADGRHAWIQILRGEMRLGDMALRAGDGVACSEEASVSLRGETDAEFMLFDLA